MPPRLKSEQRDGLKGMSEALEAGYLATTLQTCLVHLIRNSLDLAGRKDRKALAAALPSSPPRRRPRLRWPRSMASPRARGGAAFRRSWPPSGAPGRTSFRSLPSRRRCGA